MKGAARAMVLINKIVESKIKLLTTNPTEEQTRELVKDITLSNCELWRMFEDKNVVNY